MTDTASDNRALWLEREKAVRARLTSQTAPVPPAALAQRSGLELLQSVMAGELPAPPIGITLDFFLVDVAPGRAVFQGNPRASFYNPIGSVHGGWTSTLLDSCVACAVHSTLPAGKGYTTIELKVNFVRAVMPDIGPMRAEGKVINVGNRIGTAEGRLVDASGKLYAHATTTCLIFDVREAKGEAPGR